jgi:uncharacterized protein (DUF2336 family)
MSVVSGLIQDLEGASSRDKRVENLRRVTDLFLRDHGALTDEQVDLFDIVIARLAVAIETRARAELADRLADVANAPRGVVRSLAHDEIAVARPVLERSPRLSDDDLVSVALARGREHMLAITQRPLLAETVTDVLVRRGDRRVLHAAAGHPGARFSQGALSALVDRARVDDALQGLLGGRVDLPEAQLGELVAIAKEAARRRLAEAVPAGAGPAVGIALARSATSLEAQVVPGRPDYARAIGLVADLAARRGVGEAEVAALAGTGQFEETVCAVAHVAGLTVSSVEGLFLGPDPELLLVAGRALRWSWPTMKALLALRGPEAAQPHHLKRAADTFDGLSPATAGRVLDALKVREAARQRGHALAAGRQMRSNAR